MKATTTEPDAPEPPPGWEWTALRHDLLRDADRVGRAGGGDFLEQASFGGLIMCAQDIDGPFVDAAIARFSNTLTPVGERLLADWEARYGAMLDEQNRESERRWAAHKAQGERHRREVAQKEAEIQRMCERAAAEARRRGSAVDIAAAALIEEHAATRKRSVTHWAPGGRECVELARAYLADGNNVVKEQN